MKRFHFIVGLLLFVAFLLTGQYMDKFHNHLESTEIGIRMLFRTRHIFVLLASFVHLALGLYHQPRAEQWQRRVQVSGSGALTVGALLLIVAFWLEPPVRNLATPYSHWAIYLMLAGIILHAASGWRTPSIR